MLFFFITLPLFCTNTTRNFQKLPSYTFYEGDALCLPGHFFFSLALIFTLMAASIPFFLSAAIKFLCFSSNGIGVLWFFSLVLALSLLSTSMKTLKLSRKKESAFVVIVFISKRPKRAGAWNAKFHPGLHEGVDLCTDVPHTDDFLRTKISWTHSLSNYLTHGAPLRAGELCYQSKMLYVFMISSL